MTVPARDVTVSVVSHGQNALVNQLLEDVQRVCADRVALVVTENIRDRVALATALPFERIVNERIKGFGANHNAAFQHCRTPYFCVLNPDIRLPADPFRPLLEALAGERVAVAAPLVRNPAGGIEDSARRFPTAASLLKKAFVDRRQPDYPTDRGTQDVDWVAGMFMLFRAEAYRAARGFDEAYFMYYEDVDLCRRLRAAGESVRYVPAAEVVHDARRASRRDARLAMQHLKSIARFLSSS
jgi:N-acetylglucosaminyl-diphospho-decaprenol L-rhamnosyltransferase